MTTETNATFTHATATQFDPIDCFKHMIMARTINETMKARKTQGRFPFYIGAGGHEAIAGAIAALRPDDWLSLYYRDLAGWMQRTNDPYGPIRAAYSRTTDPMTAGRNMPEHFSMHAHNIMPTFSEVAGLAPFAAGAAYAFKRTHSNQIVFFCTGDGGVATNDFNVLVRAATIHRLPIIICVEDNGWAITTPVEGNQWGGNLVEWARGAGAHAVEMDGSNAIDLHAATLNLAEIARGGTPVFLHLKMGLLDSHSSSTDIYAYRDRSEVARTKQTRDPIINTGRVLIERGILTEEAIAQLHHTAKEQLNQIEDEVALEPTPTGARLHQHLYHFPEGPTIVPTGAAKQMNMLQAINDGLAEIARSDDGFFVYGQDVGSPRGGVFGATQSLVTDFPQAAISSPLNEQLIFGIAAGAAMVAGRTRCAEIQFVDYHQSAAQSLRLAARIAYQSFGDWTCPVLIRTKAGSGGGGPISDSGAGGGAFGHSHSGEYWFTSTPGLITLSPSNPYDAKGLLIEATRSQSPVVFLERGRLYRSDPPKDAQDTVIAAIAELWQVPAGYYTVPLRQARRIRIGSGFVTATIVTWGTMMLESAIAATQVAQQHGATFDIIDLRTLYPFDEATISAAITESNRVVVVTEEGDHTSFGRHLHSWIVQHHFEDLDMPAAFICAQAVPAAPYYGAEEEAFYPTAKDIEVVLQRFATA